LAEVKEVPKDATAVFVLGPISSYFDDEAKNLKLISVRAGHLRAWLISWFQ
jgi:hypothetical protein